MTVRTVGDRRIGARRDAAESSPRSSIGARICPGLRLTAGGAGSAGSGVLRTDDARKRPGWSWTAHCFSSMRPGNASQGGTGPWHPAVVWWDQFNGLLELTLDYENDAFVVVHADRGEFRRQNTGTPRLLDFKRATVRVPERTLVLVTPTENTVEVELYWFDDQRARLGARPVIYLDQNKWVQISRAINRPQQVQPALELDATLQVVEFARTKKVVLPLSSGHYIETGPLYDDRRRDLATLMVDLSAGWVMRDPLTVRMQELVVCFQAKGYPACVRQPVFTLDPDALQTRMEIPEEPDPSSLDAVNRVFAGASARFAVLLENEAIHNPEGAAYTARWAAAQQGAADILRSDATVRLQARGFTLRAFLSDLGLHLTAACRSAGIDPDAFGDWLRGAPDDQIRHLPYLGRAREVHHQRLMNAQDRWRPNDLIDWLFLPLAAGYADHVVCENSHGHQLRRAGQAVNTAGAQIQSTFADLVPHLSGV